MINDFPDPGSRSDWARADVTMLMKRSTSNCIGTRDKNPLHIASLQR